jgi:hypothetical protein
MTIRSRPILAAVTGSLFILPLMAANAIVGHKIEPFFSLVRPGTHTSTREYVLLVILLALLPAGAWLATRPMLRSGVARSSRIDSINAVVAAILLLVFVAVSIGLAADVYRCNVLDIPNCD